MSRGRATVRSVSEPANSPKTALTPIVFGRPFAKGKSGNPSGVPKKVREVRKLAQKYAPEAIMRLVELMESEDEAIAGRAACAILDRAGVRSLAYGLGQAEARAHDATDAIGRLMALVSRRVTPPGETGGPAGDETGA